MRCNVPYIWCSIVSAQTSLVIARLSYSLGKKVKRYNSFLRTSFFLFSNKLVNRFYNFFYFSGRFYLLVLSMLPDWKKEIDKSTRQRSSRDMPLQHEYHRTKGDRKLTMIVGNIWLYELAKLLQALFFSSISPNMTKITNQMA